MKKYCNKFTLVEILAVVALIGILTAIGFGAYTYAMNSAKESSTKALIKQAFDKAFAKYDVILGPAAPTTAPKLGESLSDPLKMYLGDIYTISVNLAGLPGMSVPCGRDAKGLPIGLQLIGDCFKEKNIIRAAYAYEQTRKYEAPKLAKTAEGEAK